MRAGTRGQIKPHQRGLNPGWDGTRQEPGTDPQLPRPGIHCKTLGTVPGARHQFRRSRLAHIVAAEKQPSYLPT